MEKAKAYIKCSLNVVCPNCGDDIDLMKQDEGGCYSNPLFTDMWEDIEDGCHHCPECGAEFKISKVEF